MVKGKTMLQVQGVFGVAQNVQTEIASSLYAYTWLKGAPRNRVTVREVSAQQAYFSGFSGPSGSGTGSVISGGAAVATLTLIVGSSKNFAVIQAMMKEHITFGKKYYFHAPSYRDSPDVEGADLAFLAVVPPWKLQSAKRMSGHAYLDEEAVPLPPVTMKKPPKKALHDLTIKGKATKTSQVKKTGKVLQGLISAIWHR
ncbi:MAG: hypothetical protein OEQ53_19560 [Saprospiraceae bacterium]|nr:hypothetical protein [Saprospiraceae bacterium]